MHVLAPHPASKFFVLDASTFFELAVSDCVTPGHAHRMPDYAVVLPSTDRQICAASSVTRCRRPSSLGRANTKTRRRHLFERLFDLLVAALTCVAGTVMRRSGALPALASPVTAVRRRRGICEGRSCSSQDECGRNEYSSNASFHCRASQSRLPRHGVRISTLLIACPFCIYDATPARSGQTERQIVHIGRARTHRARGCCAPSTRAQIGCGFRATRNECAGVEARHPAPCYDAWVHVLTVAWSRSSNSE
jgi:hypothetical protein